MKRPSNTFALAILAATLGLVGAGAVAWMMTSPSPAEPQRNAGARDDERLAKLEQTVAALTEALHERQAHAAVPVASVAAQGTVADDSPEARPVRDEAAVEAEIRASPENHEAYRRASDAVARAVADKRWTEEDREILAAAVAHLTRDQMVELTGALLPAVNSGEVKVEVMGPLF